MHFLYWEKFGVISTGCWTPRCRIGNCNLVCYTNWSPLMVDSIILFLSVLTWLDRWLVLLVIYPSQLILFTVCLSLFFFFLIFWVVFCGEKLVFERVCICHVALQEWIWHANFLLAVVFNIYREHFALRGHLSVFKGLLNCLLIYFIADVPLVLFDVLSLNSKYNAKL